LPEAAQNAPRGKAPPRGWPEIGETAERVKELAGAARKGFGKQTAIERLWPPLVSADVRAIADQQDSYQIVNKYM